MALTVFLFNVSNIELPKSKHGDEISISSQENLVETVQEDSQFLFCAKATFRG